jgi:16S rRNA (adenine1518-N6/adenine1519-N6)-dimethyltransferase
MNDKLFNKDYLFHLCQKYNLRPSKQYGQNFLINQEVVEAIISSAKIKKTETIVEIGPGFGALTFALAEKAKNIIAFEIEKKLQEYWNQNFKNIQIVWGNVLRTEQKLFPKKYRVISNIPYQITSNIIKFFLHEIENRPHELILMVQKEVAERICAVAGRASLLSLSVQMSSDAEIIGEIKRNNFYPEPKVDSAVIKISVKDKFSTEEIQNTFKYARVGFAQKRKLLVKNLLGFVGKQNKNILEKKLAEMGFSPLARAQELSTGQWVELSTYLQKNSVV